MESNSFTPGVVLRHINLQNFLLFFAVICIALSIMAVKIADNRPANSEPRSFVKHV